MDEQRKLRNLLSYTKTDSVEEIEEVGKLYEELLTYINKSKKEHELLGLHGKLSYYSKYDAYDKETRDRVLELKDDISQLKKELEKMK